MDHTNDAQVEELFTRIKREQDGRLDLLVNNAFGAISAMLSQCAGDEPKYWEEFEISPTELWDRTNTVGLRGAYVCSVLGTRIMLESRPEGASKVAASSKQRPGLIVNISSFGGQMYMFNVPYGVGKNLGLNPFTLSQPLHVNLFSIYLGKCATDRMTSDMAMELNSRDKDIYTVSIWPGPVRTELFVNHATTIPKPLPFKLEEYGKFSHAQHWSTFNG